jgi:hypothetical protein
MICETDSVCYTTILLERGTVSKALPYFWPLIILHIFMAAGSNNIPPMVWGFLFLVTETSKDAIRAVAEVVTAVLISLIVYAFLVIILKKL